MFNQEICYTNDVCNRLLKALGIESHMSHGVHDARQEETTNSSLMDFSYDQVCSCVRLSYECKIISRHLAQFKIESTAAEIIYAILYVSMLLAGLIVNILTLVLLLSEHNRSCFVVWLKRLCRMNCLGSNSKNEKSASLEMSQSMSNNDFGIMRMSVATTTMTTMNTKTLRSNRLSNSSLDEPARSDKYRKSNKLKRNYHTNLLSSILFAILLSSYFLFVFVVIPIQLYLFLSNGSSLHGIKCKCFQFIKSTSVSLSVYSLMAISLQRLVIFKNNKFTKELHHQSLWSLVRTNSLVKFLRSIICILHTFFYARYYVHIRYTLFLSLFAVLAALGVGIYDMTLYADKPIKLRDYNFFRDNMSCDFRLASNSSYYVLHTSQARDAHVTQSSMTSTASQASDVVIEHDLELIDTAIYCTSEDESRIFDWLTVSDLVFIIILLILPNLIIALSYYKIAINVWKKSHNLTTQVTYNYMSSKIRREQSLFSLDQHSNTGASSLTTATMATTSPTTSSSLHATGSCGMSTSLPYNVSPPSCNCCENISKQNSMFKISSTPKCMTNGKSSKFRVVFVSNIGNNNSKRIIESPLDNSYGGRRILASPTTIGTTSLISKYASSTTVYNMKHQQQHQMKNQKRSSAPLSSHIGNGRSSEDSSSTSGSTSNSVECELANTCPPLSQSEINLSSGVPNVPANSIITSSHRYIPYNSVVLRSKFQERIIKKRNLSVTLTMCLMVGIFTLCWAPFFILPSFYSLFHSSASYKNYKVAIQCIAYSSCIWNPIILIIKSKRFKVQLHSVKLNINKMFKSLVRLGSDNESVTRMPTVVSNSHLR